MKKTTKKEELIRFCPKCKSTSTGYYQGDSPTFAIGLPTKFTCYDCGFTDYVFPEAPKKDLGKGELKQIKVKPSEKQIPDTPQYGNFMTKIELPLAIILGAIFLILAIISKDTVITTSYLIAIILLGGLYTASRKAKKSKK